MKKVILAAAVMCFSSFASAVPTNTWYAGTAYEGRVNTQGLIWTCTGGTCTLSGPYGNGLNMSVCKELSRKVGGLSYYYNETGMTWSATKNSALLDQCNRN